MNYKSLLLMAIPILVLAYWTYNKFEGMEKMYIKHIKSLNETISSLETDLKIREEREMDLVKENQILHTKISEYKSKLNSNQTVKVKKKTNEKIVPINHVASKRINEFLSKRYRHKER